VPNYSAWSSPASATTPPARRIDHHLHGRVQRQREHLDAGGTAFTYSTTVNHGTYTGAGAAYCGAGAASQMYAHSPPVRAGKVWGYYYDGKGGWKAGICGWSYRTALSLRDPNQAAKMYIDNEFYNTPDNSKYYYRWLREAAGHTPSMRRATRTPTATGPGSTSRPR